MKPRILPARAWRAGSPLSRRSVLQGLLGGAAVSLTLPPLQAMFNANGTAYAADGQLPTRFGVWIWGNGVVPDRWVPKATGVDEAWALSDELQPLAAHKAKFNVVSGFACKNANVGPHLSGKAAVLTGRAETTVSGNTTVAGPSIDQVIAGAVGGTTIYRSLQTAASDTGGESWNGPNSKNPAERDPYTMFRRLFGDTFVEPGSDGVVDPRLGLKRSLLDAVMDDIARLEGRLGASDRVRLDQHLTGVREIEQRLAILQANPPSLAACRRADEPTGTFDVVGGRPPVREVNRAMSRMMAMALACDQTRVWHHAFSGPVSDVLYEGATAGHHDLTHNEAPPQDQVHGITVRIMQGLADTLAELDAIEEGDGTLLDHMALLCTTEVSLAQVHSILDMPVIIAGSANGFYRTGQHVRSVGAASVTRVLVSLQQAMGMPVASFGEDDTFAAESIPELEA